MIDFQTSHSCLHQDRTTTNPMTYTVSEIGYGLHINPFYSQVHTSKYHTLVFESLFRADATEPWKLHALLANHIMLAPSGHWALITLHPYAYFHDQTPITAKDVAASLQYAMRDLPTKILSHQIRISTPDSHSLFIQSAFALDRQTLFSLLQYPITQAACTQSIDCMVSPIASGPYSVVHHKTNEITKYQSVTNYWGNQHPFRQRLYPFKNINVLYFRNSQIAFLDFLKGSFDYFPIRYYEQWQTLQRNNHPRIHLHQYKRHTHPGLSGFYTQPTHEQLERDLAIRKNMFDLFHSLHTDKKIFQTSMPYSTSLFIENIEHAYPSSRPTLQIIRTLQHHLKQRGWVFNGHALMHTESNRACKIRIDIPNAHIEKMAIPWKNILQRMGCKVDTFIQNSAIQKVATKDYHLHYSFLYKNAFLHTEEATQLLQTYQSIIDTPNQHAPCVFSMTKTKMTHTQHRQELARCIYKLHLFLPSWFDTTQKHATWSHQLGDLAKLASNWQA